MKKVNGQNLYNELPDKIDLFLCSSSFEERCFAVSKAISTKKINSSLIFYNHDQKDSILSNANKLKEILDKSELVSIHSNDPVFTLNKIFRAINISSKKMNIVLDTTTFTHEGLLILFKVINLKKNNNTNLFLVYNGAKEYSTNVYEIEKKWLSKGVGEVRTVLGYSGFINPSLKNHLIVLFGFEVERTLRVIDIFEPDSISIGIAEQAYSINDEHYKINKIRHEYLTVLHPRLTNFSISLINPIDTSRQLKDEIRKYSNCNIIIAPMNNKFSTIGAALVAEADDNVQICYIPANIYNREGYSSPSNDFYIFKLPFTLI